MDHKNLDPHRSSGCKASSLTAEPEEGPGVGQLQAIPAHSPQHEHGIDHYKEEACREKANHDLARNPILCE